MADTRNPANVIIGAPNIKTGGGINLGKPATEESQLPTTAAQDLSTALEQKPSGFISEDGVTKTVDEQVEKIKDMNGDTVLVITKERTVELKLTFLEAKNANVLKMIAGEDNVSITAGTIVVRDADGERPHRSVDLGLKSSATSKTRVFAPDAQITKVGDVTFVNSKVIQYEVTMECFGGPNGVKLLMITDDPDIEAEDTE